MFGISATKLFVLVGAIIGIFLMMRTVRRLREWVRAREERLERDAAATPVADLTRCRVCDAYVASNARACDRPNCPKPR